MLSAETLAHGWMDMGGSQLRSQVLLYPQACPQREYSQPRANLPDLLVDGRTWRMERCMGSPVDEARSISPKAQCQNWRHRACN